MKKSKVISYGGYYSTGGSVVRDIFREFDPGFELPIEFRLLKERFGLLDLERVLFNDYAPENIDLAIKDFIWITEQLGRDTGRFKKAGFSYNRYTNNIFSSSTSDFINDITDYEYPMSWHFYDFKKNYFDQIFRRIIKFLFIKNIRTNQGDTKARISYIEKEKYYIAARKYIDSIIFGIQKYNNNEMGSVVGLHNAVPCFSTNQIDNSLKYFQSCKIILTDRDPRDVFLNYPKDSYGRYLPIGNNITNKVKCFIHFYKSIRINQKNIIKHPKVLFLKFEDICYNYEQNYNRIIRFCELDINQHKNKGKKFSPKDSIKNIGLWKKAKGELAKSISLIEKELPEFLYEN
jgi:hypothetical protein